MREGVVFERLLLGQTQQKVFIINNTSLLPVKWRVAGADILPPEFKVIPSSGEVPPRQETPVTVEFTAIQKKDLSEKVTLQVSNHKRWTAITHTARSVIAQKPGSAPIQGKSQSMQGCRECKCCYVALSSSLVRHTASTDPTSSSGQTTLEGQTCFA